MDVVLGECHTPWVVVVVVRMNDPLLYLLVSPIHCTGPSRVEIDRLDPKSRPNTDRNLPRVERKMEGWGTKVWTTGLGVTLP